MFFWDHWLQWFNHWLLAATASEVMAASETELLDDTSHLLAKFMHLAMLHFDNT
jgi:hypothetical protein